MTSRALIALICVCRRKSKCPQHDGLRPESGLSPRRREVRLGGPEWFGRQRCRAREPTTVGTACTCRDTTFYKAFFKAFYYAVQRAGAGDRAKRDGLRSERLSGRVVASLGYIDELHP